MTLHTDKKLTDALAQCPLFAALTRDDWALLLTHSTLRTLAAGQQLLTEGDIGDEMYVLVTGALEALKHIGDEEVILRRLEHVGAHVGEMALLASSNGVRRATVRCLNECQVLAIPKRIFLQTTGHNPALQAQMHVIHQRQLQQLSLVEQSMMYRALVLFDQQHGWSREQHFQAGQSIFHQGDTATAVFVIRSGSVKISRVEEGQENILLMLHAGQTFGERAVLEDRPRWATATATSTLELVTLDRKQFLHASATTPELHAYLGTLQRVYAMGKATATLFDGEFRGQPAVVTVVRLDDGREIIANHVVNRAIYSAALEIPVDAVCQEFTYRDDQRGILRTLAIRDHRLARVHVEGPWTELSQLHALLLEQTPIEDSTLLQQFTHSGHLLEPAPAQLAQTPSAILCECLKLTRQTVESAIAHGAVTLEKLSRSTGATTVCGGCTSTLATMIDSTGQAVKLIEKIQVLPNVRAFRFAPCQTPMRSALPGQHVIVSAKIDGTWFHRPYTITSPARCTAWREITVKREEHGLLSYWLFNQPQHPRFLLSQPQGTFWVDPELGETVVCLVAGIGMTPALAIARSISAQRSEQILHIDYSARTQSDFAYRSEFDALTAQHSNISVHYRCTGARQHLTSSEIQAIHSRLPNARYLICGPKTYLQSVRDMLTTVGIRPRRVQVEVFTAVGHAPQQQPIRARSTIAQLHMIATLTLCVLYLLQSTFDWALADLLRMQQQVGYRIATGALLLALIGYQWYWPYLRFSQQAAKHPKHGHRHRLLGILAPLLLYLHSTVLGFGYTCVLSLFFLLNTMIGAMDKTRISNPLLRQYLATGQLLMHIPLSCLVTVLALFHMIFAPAYK